jgi:hypothetical protein
MTSSKWSCSLAYFGKINGVSSKSMVFKGNTNGFSMEFKLKQRVFNLKTNGNSIENKWFLNVFSLILLYWQVLQSLTCK